MSNDYARAASLNQLKNSLGWRIALELAEEIVAGFEKKALSCDEDSRIVGLQRQAKAAREFLENLKARIDLAASITPEESGI